MNLTFLITQMLKTDAALHAYAKVTLNKEKHNEFINEISNQFKISLKQFVEDNPSLKIDGKEDLLKSLED